jgi:hypothetical protein
MGVRAGDLLRDPSDRERMLEVLVLVVSRGGETMMLPDDDVQLQIGDVVLFCGTRRARQLLGSTLSNPYTLHYLTTGEHAPRAWFFQWLYPRLAASRASSASE